MLGCRLTPPVNNSFTGTVVVSSAFAPSASVLTSVSNQTVNRTSIVRAAVPYLDVVSLNGVKHHMDQPSMPKAAVFLR